MSNIIKMTAVAGFFALVACSDDSLSGAAIEPNTVAHNSSSSVADASSSSSSPRYSNNVPEITFVSQPTKVASVAAVTLSEYEQEFGAEASCNADGKSYVSKIKALSDTTFVRSIELRNMGSDCEAIFLAFVESCPNHLAIGSVEASCSSEGSVDAFCYDENAIVCTVGIPPSCKIKTAKSVSNFGSFVDNLLEESNEICSGLQK